MLADEVGHFRRVGGGLGAVAVDGGLDEVLDAAGRDGGVDEGGALVVFRVRGVLVVGGGGGRLDAEDGVDGLGRGGEDGGGVGEVAFDELDFGGGAGEGLGRGGGGVAGYGEDGDVGAGVDEGFDDGAALFAGSAGDEDGLGHIWVGRW